jgi:hypothetical protein
MVEPEYCIRLSQTEVRTIHIAAQLPSEKYMSGTITLNAHTKSLRTTCENIHTKETQTWTQQKENNVEGERVLFSNTLWRVSPMR